MKGISIVLPNTDFSNSPLGRVTFVQTTEERAMGIMTDYVAAANAGAYSSAVYNMVLAMINAGVYDKLVAFWPMLGSTTHNMAINLLDTTKNALELKENASVSGLKLSFANNIDVTLPIKTTIWYPAKETVSPGIFLKAKRGNGSLNSSWMMFNPEFRTSLISSKKQLSLRIYQTNYVLAADGTEEHAYAFVKNGDYTYISVDNGTPTSDSFSGRYNNAVGDNVLGGVIVEPGGNGYIPAGTPGQQVAESQYLWGGTVSYLLFADGLTSTEMQALSTILADFCTAVGK